MNLAAKVLCVSFALPLVACQSSAPIPDGILKLTQCDELKLETVDRDDVWNVTVDYFDHYTYSANAECMNEMHKAALAAGYVGNENALGRELKAGSRDELVFDWNNMTIEWLDSET